VRCDLVDDSFEGYKLYCQETVDNLMLKHRNELPDLLVEKNLNGIGIEIGVKEGKFSDIILRKSKLQTLVSLDAWNNILDMQEAFKRLARRPRSVCVKAESKTGVNIFQDNFFDFIYIDANHTFKFIAEDLKNWWPKLKPGGLISGHDYQKHTHNKQVFGVVEAVDRFVKEHQLELHVTRESKFPSWYFFKPELIPFL